MPNPSGGSGLLSLPVVRRRIRDALLLARPPLCPALVQVQRLYLDLSRRLGIDPDGGTRPKRRPRR